MAVVALIASLACGNVCGQQTITQDYNIDKKTADMELTDNLRTFRCISAAAADSVCRSLLGRYAPEGELPLNITHRRYGKLQPELSMTLKNFICLFMEEFDFYCSVGETDGKNVSLTLILRHKNIRFIHMLLANGRTEEFLSGKKAVEADLYSYIPQKF
jgi:hypothetical protein